MIKRKAYIIVVLLLAGLHQVFFVDAQDIHFSQFLSSPLNLNPALPGISGRDIRIAGNYRNQWQTITVPYKTNSLSVDAGFQPQFLGKNRLGLGFLIVNDKAGDADFGSFKAQAFLAYHQSLNLGYPSQLSLGIGGGVVKGNLNPGELYFDSQWDGNKFDPDLPVNQVISRDDAAYPDFVAGLNFMSAFSDQVSFSTGFSFFHFNNPSFSFFDGPELELDKRYLIHGIVDWQMMDNLILSPLFLYMRQGKYNEFDTGLLSTISTNSPVVPAFYAGSWVRWGDAVIFNLGMDYKKLHVGLSYDFNISSVTKASSGFEGFELSVIYLISRKSGVNVPVKVCPVFM